MAASRTQDVFLPRRGKRVSSIKSTQVARSTVADTWRWLWPDVLMRIIPLGAIPFLYIVLFHLPLSFLGLTLRNWPLQLALGCGIGLAMRGVAFVGTQLILSIAFKVFDWR